MSGAACDECGATGSWGSCSELFSCLLALDHERRSPWADHHAVNVACYLLQHPSQTRAHTLTGQWRVIELFVRGDLSVVHAWTAQRVARNSHRRDKNLGSDDLPHPPDPLRAPVFTIEDVSVDGTFPADGANERIRDWAEATAASRQAEDTSED